MNRKRFTSLALLAVLLITPACAARKPGTPIKPGFNLFSKEQDIQLGKEAAAQVRQQFDIVQNQQLQDYIKRVGQKLASTPEAGDFPYTFTLINAKEINAFALPGGPTFVFTGLLQAADNEAQLAGVMAHEISHVALRHGTNQASKANLIQLPAALAGAAVGSGSLLGQLSQLGLGIGLNSLFMKFSRTDENQADALGAKIMAQAGYNPVESARFFEKLEAEGGSRAPEFLSSHPSPGNRVKAVEAEVRALPQQNYATGQTGEFQQAKQMIAQLPPPRKQPQQIGASAPPSGGSPSEPPSGAPSGGSRQIQGRTFAVSYPDNWEAFGGKDSGSITIAPRQGLVQGSGGAVQIGYGVILSYFNPQSNRANLNQWTSELVRSLRAQNPSMQTSGQSRKVRVDGQSGLVTPLTSESPYGGQETDMLLTVARPEGLFYMVFIGPQRDWNQLQGTFEQMIRTIRFTS